MLKNIIGLALCKKGLDKKLHKIFGLTGLGTIVTVSNSHELFSNALPNILFIEEGFLSSKEWPKFHRSASEKTDSVCIILKDELLNRIPKKVITLPQVLLLTNLQSETEVKVAKLLLHQCCKSANMHETDLETCLSSMELIDRMVWAFNEQFEIVYVNSAAKAYTVKSTGHSISGKMSIRELYAPDTDMESIAEWKKLFIQAFNGEIVETTLPLIGKANPYFITELRLVEIAHQKIVLALVREIGAVVQKMSVKDITPELKGLPKGAFSDNLFIVNRNCQFVLHKEDASGAESGYADFLGKHISEVMPVDVSSSMEQCIAAAFGSGHIQILQYNLFYHARLHYFEAKFALLDNDRVIMLIRDNSVVKSGEMLMAENEKRFLLMLKHTGQILYDYDIPSGTVKWFGSMEKLEGRSGLEFSALGFRRWQELIHPDDRGMVAIKRRMAEETRSIFHLQYQVMLPDEHRIYIEDRGAFMYTESGESYRILGTLNDISKERETRLALQKSEERYKAFISQSSEAIWCFELTEPIDITLPVERQIELFFEQGYLSDCNHAYAKMYGVSDVSEIIGMPLGTVLVKEDKSNIDYLRAFIANSYILNDAESVEVDFSGKLKYFLNNLVGIVSNGCIERAWGTQRDITHLRQVEEAQKTAEKKYREIFENAIEGIYQSSFEGYFLNLNPAMAAMYGYESPFEMMQVVKNIGLQCYDSSGERLKFLALIKSIGKVQGFESMAVKKDGSKFWISENARLIVNELTGEEHVEGMVEDITRRKVAAQNLIEREELYRSLVDHSPDAITVYVNNLLVYANPSCFAMFAATKTNDIIGKSPLDFVHLDSRELAVEQIKQLADQHSYIGPVEEKFVKIDGTVFYAEVTAMPISWSGQPAVQLILRDLSSKKREEFIRESENTVYAMIAQTTSLQSILSKICELNDYFYENCNTVIYLNIRGIYSIAAAPSIRYELRRPLETLEQTGIAQVAGKLKMPFFLQNLLEVEQWNEYALAMDKLGYKACWAKPISDMKGVLYGVMMYYFTKETTPQLYNERLAEHFINLTVISIEKRKLEEENSNLSLVARQTTSAVSILDNDFQTIWINEGYEKLTGYKLDELRGQLATDLLHGPQTDRTITDESLMELRQNGSVRYETFNYTKDGKGYWVSVQIDRMFDSKNNHIGYFMIENDITERIEQEKAIKEAQMRAEEASRLKSAFLANMSHEIRTPMNGILGFADILRSELMTIGQEELYKFSETIYNSGRRLLNLLNDILDISRIEADRLDLAVHECRLDEVLIKTLTLLKPLAERKGLVLDYTELKETYVHADENRLHQVFNNVIGNAIKFTSSGSVRVATRKIEVDGKRMAKISVTDTGRGIEPSFLQHIFEPFMQESTGFSRSHEGSGLGLAISQRLIHLMNGKIEVESELHAGTTVHIMLELSEEKFFPIVDNHGEQDLVKEFGTLVARRPKVFVVEDDETSRILFERAVGEFADLRLAANGDEALQQFSGNRQVGWIPDIILLDIGLPSPWDGIKLRKAICEQFSEAKAIPMVAQTAYAMRDERENFIKEGFAVVLTKPLNRREVLTTLLHYTRENQQ